MAELTPQLSILYGRLDQLERSMEAFEQRLHATEEILRLTTPLVAEPPATLTTVAQELPLASAAFDATPIPELAAAGSDAGNVLAAARTLLDGEHLSAPPPAQETSEHNSVQLSVSWAQGTQVFAAGRRAVSLAELERAVSERGLAWVGGLALSVGSAVLPSLAMSRGWIGPEARVAIGLVAGLVVTVLGDRLTRGGDRVLGSVLVAVGIGIWSLALVAGTRLYDVIPLWTALLGTLAGGFGRVGHSDPR